VNPTPTLVRTSCTRDCPDACSLVATVDAEGVVTRLQGDPDHPVTRGFLCYRVGTHFLARHGSSERLTTPLLRNGDHFEPIEWDAALDLAARKLRAIRDESGGAAILHSQGGGSLGILKNLNGYFSRLLGASELSGDVCDGAGSYANESDFGAVESNAIEDLVNARTIVLWGKNPANSSPHTTPFLLDAKRAGATIIVIDPLATRVRSLAHRVIAPRPGGDGALALGACLAVIEQGGVHRDLHDYSEGFDAFVRLVTSRSVVEWAREADVSAGEIRDLAAAFVENAPVTTLVGWGLQRRLNGATQIRAIDALHAITGNVGIAGGGASFGVTRRKPFDLGFKSDLAARVPRALPIARMGHAILEAKDPPVRAVLIDNHNPVATNPESDTTARALLSREFTLVIDSFLTDTARCAHLVLPSTTMLEEDDLVGSYGHHYVTASRAVARRLPGTRSDFEIYQALAQRLGFGDAFAGTPESWMERMLGKLAGRGVDRSGLLAAARHDPNAPRIAFEGRKFATPSGRFRFLAEHRAPPAHDAEYPLRFQALSTNRWQASQLTEADEDREGRLEVTAHPAACRGIVDGGEAWLESRVGKLRVIVRHDSAFRADTIYAPRARSHRRGFCVNAIISARETDFGGGAAYYDEPVRLRAITSP
jgi:anaerobic selenocysteine-containing dehydrogenase